MGADRGTRVAAAIGVAGTAGVAALFLLPDRTARSDRFALVAVFAVPAALAVASLFHRPVLLAPAAMLSVGLSPVLWSGVFLLLVPGIAYTTAYLQAPRTATASRSRGAIAVLVPTGATIVAIRLLMSETSERCVSSATSTTCSSVTTPTRAAVAAVLAGTAVLTGWLAATRTSS